MTAVGRRAARTMSRRARHARRVASRETAAAPSPDPRPYRPSWVDRVTDGLATLPADPVVAHVTLAAILVGVQLVTLSFDRVAIAHDVRAIVVFNGLFVPFLLGVLAVLDRRAMAALRAMRPALRASPAELAGYAYRLATMPRPVPLLAGSVAVVAVVALEQLQVTSVSYYASLAGGSVSSVVFHLVDKASAFLLGVVVYHTIRQLRLVDAIHAYRVEIDLFDLEPLRACSTLTAATAASLVIGVYGWVLIVPEVRTDPVVVGFAVAVTVVAASVFVLPLYRVHRRMQIEQAAALRRIRRRLADAVAQFDHACGRGDPQVLDHVNGLISSLAVQEERMAGVRTWPWRPGVARSALTVIVIPFALTLVGAYLA